MDARGSSIASLSMQRDKLELTLRLGFDRQSGAAHGELDDLCGRSGSELSLLAVANARVLRFRTSIIHSTRIPCEPANGRR